MAKTLEELRNQLEEYGEIYYDKPVCPFCLAVDDDPLIAVPRNERLLSGCPSCGAEFEFEITITVDCTSRPIAQPATTGGKE